MYIHKLLEGGSNVLSCSVNLMHSLLLDVLGLLDPDVDRPIVSDVAAML